MTSDIDEVIEINVGGVYYTSTRKTLTSDKNSRLAELFDEDNASSALRDAKGRIVLDRDGALFRYILDYLRDDSIQLPDAFREKERLMREAEYFRLSGLIHCMKSMTEARTGCITLGYRGSFQFGKDGLADVKFRKLSRILICGRVNLCRDVFGETLNESRDPDHGGPKDRYTSRFFLKHCFIEQAFDMLHDQGFRLAGCCASGTSAASVELKPGIDTEESRWSHYNEFVFIRE